MRLELYVVTACAILAACGPGGGAGETDTTTQSGTSETGAPTTSPTSSEGTSSGGTADETSGTTSEATTADDSTTGPPAPLECEVTPVDHAAACGDPCPVAVDLEIRCDDIEFAAPGMDIAAAPDTLWFVTSGTLHSVLFKADAAGAERVEGVVEEFPREAFELALAPDGAPHLAVDASTFAGPDDYPGGVVHRTLANGAWTSSTAYDVPDHYTSPDTLLVDSQGQARVYVGEPNIDGFMRAVRTGETWQVGEIATPAYGAYNQFLIGPGDQDIALAMPNERIAALVGGELVEFGPKLGASYEYQAASAPTGPLLGAGLQAEEGLEVAWFPADGPVSWKIAGTGGLPESSCGSDEIGGPDLDCPGPCHESLVGVQRSSFSFARTGDGVGWLAWVVTRVERDLSYDVAPYDDAFFYCGQTVDKDESTAELHLTRVVHGALEPTEVLMLPLSSDINRDMFDNLSSRIRAVELTAFGADLALALRQVEKPESFVRILRIDTTKIP